MLSFGIFRVHSHDVNHLWPIQVCFSKILLYRILAVDLSGTDRVLTFGKGTVSSSGAERSPVSLVIFPIVFVSLPRLVRLVLPGQ